MLMMKLALWVVTTSLIAFLASSYSLVLENIVFLSLLSLGALLVAIIPVLFYTKR